MRVTQNMEQAQFLSALNQLESGISRPKTDFHGIVVHHGVAKPVGAGLVTGYNQVLAQSQQYTANGNSAQTELEYRGQRTHAVAESAAKPA